MSKKLYECTGRVYVLAEDKDEARAIASRESQDEEWDADVATAIDVEWQNTLPYCDEPEDELTCQQVLEAQEQEA